MASPLIRSVTGLSQVGYGVNIWDTPPVTPVRGTSPNVIGMVAELPWGPVDEAVTVTTPAEFFATFYPAVFGALKDYATYPAILAVLNKPIFTRGGLRVVRVGATGQAKATKTFQDADPADSAIVTARFPGAIGNQIQIAWSANADDSSARDMTVTIGSAYSVTYPAVAASDGTVTDPGDPYVEVVAAPGAAAPPAVVSATALASGSNGTAVAADYVGSDVSTKGIRCLYGSGAPDVLFVAECPSGIVDNVNAGLKAWGEATPSGIAVLCTPAGQSKAAAQAYAPTYRVGTAGRTYYPWPQVKTINGFDPNQGVVTVDGNAFAAALIANVDPWVSPGGAGKNQGGVDLLAGIVGLEDESASTADLDALNAAGVAPWMMEPSLGCIVRKAVTTSTSGRTKVASRRMADYLLDSIGAFAVQFVERPLDISLDPQDLGDWTGAFVGDVKGFLQAEQNAGHIRAFAVDPFSENTPADINADRWTVALAVQFMSSADEMVLKSVMGETVEITEAA